MGFPHAPHRWFYEDDPLRTGLTTAKEDLEVTFGVEITVYADRESELHDPAGALTTAPMVERYAPFVR
jgi:hypothetical protein